MVETQLKGKQQDISKTLASVSASISNILISPQLADYLSSEINSSEFYYSELRLQNVMKNSSMLSKSSMHTVGVARKGRDSLVVSATSVWPKEFFFKFLNYPVSDDLLDDKPGIRVNRTKDGNLESMLMVFSVPSSQADSVFYVHLPLQEFVRPDGSELSLSFYMAEDDRILSSDKALSEVRISEFLDGYALNQLFTDGPYTIALVEIPFSKSYLVISSKDTVSIKLWCLIIVSLGLLSLFVIVLLSRMKERLYKPIGDAVTLLSRDEETKPEDELAFIIDNCRKIDELHEELDEAMKAHRQLKEQQKYRAFIRGVETEVTAEDASSYFTLAYASVTEETENPDVVFAKINNVVKYIEHLHSVRINSTHNVYIYKSDDKQQSYDVLYSTLQTLTFDLVESNDIRFALTKPQKGYKALPGMFNAAGDMMQYRYRIKQHLVLTDADIPEAEHLMNYTFSDERILVNAMISDNEDALNIFDRIVEKNFSDSYRISEKEMVRFCYSMIGTLNRVFQEFKETPETLLGHPVDFEKLYKNRNSGEVLEEVRTAFEEILRIRKSQNAQEDNRIVIQMKEYISEHYMENLMLIDLSKKYNLTPKYCSTLFKKLSNDTFKNYLTQLRIEKACEMLEENPDMKIRDLSERVGFQSSNTFIRAFSRTLGTTPGCYAKKLQETR